MGESSTIVKMYVFNANIYIGDMYHDSKDDSYRYEQKAFCEEAEDWNVSTNAKLGSEIFRDTLYHTRVFPPNRVDAREMLRRLNLFDYDRG